MERTFSLQLEDICSWHHSRLRPDRSSVSAGRGHTSGAASHSARPAARAEQNGRRSTGCPSQSARQGRHSFGGDRRRGRRGRARQRRGYGSGGGWPSRRQSNCRRSYGESSAEAHGNRGDFLAKDTRPRDLDAMLDGIDPEAGEASSSGSGKGKAAVCGVQEVAKQPDRQPCNLMRGGRGHPCSRHQPELGWSTAQSWGL